MRFLWFSVVVLTFLGGYVDSIGKYRDNLRLIYLS